MTALSIAMALVAVPLLFAVVKLERFQLVLAVSAGVSIFTLPGLLMFWLASAGAKERTECLSQGP